MWLWDWNLCCQYVSLNERHQHRNWCLWTRYFLNEGMWNAENVLTDLKLEDGAGFKNFVRMTFWNAGQIIGYKIAQTDTKYWTAIHVPLLIQLAVTFRYLARCKSFTNLVYTFMISKKSTSAVIPEVCEALIDALRTYVKVSDCNEFYSMLYFVRYGNRICSPYTSTVSKSSNHLHTTCYLTYTF
jgi:hypothetical protein